MRALVLVVAAGCSSGGTSPKVAASKDVDARFVPAIRAAADQYLDWGRVDEDPSVAPMLCDMPRPERPGSRGTARLSEAEESPHGKKLYYLWASDRASYVKTKVATGFTIVKESFAATPATKPDRERSLRNTIEHDGHWLTTGEAKGLYVMTKVGGAGTDAGWIYGTITPDEVVTSAGRVATCMGCHEDAPHDRLFGLK